MQYRNMNIAMIVATDKYGCIGKKGGIPWYIKSELDYFKVVTTDHIVIMGKNTALSLPKYPLPNRRNIIISTTMKDSDKEIYSTLEDALNQLQTEGITTPIFIIGGNSLYTAALKYTKTLYLSRIDTVVNEGDTYFPRYSFDLDHRFIYFRDYPLLKGKVMDATTVVDKESGLSYTKYIINITRREGIELW